MRGRSLSLLLALTTGAIASLMVYMYVTGVETRTVKGQRTRPVLVASRFLPAGSTGDQVLEAGAFRVEETPVRYLAPGALTSPDQLEGVVLADDVQSGEPLTTQRFEASQQEAFLSNFPEGTEALSLPLEHVRGIGGHLAAGDRINAYATAKDWTHLLGGDAFRKFFSSLDIEKALSGDASQLGPELNRLLKATKMPATLGAFTPKEGVTMLLIEGISVVEVVDPVADGSQSASAESGRTMTIAVTPEQAALLVHSQERSKLWFTLARPDDVKEAEAS
jgi:Flp pilus assembly protein CpaB